MIIIYDDLYDRWFATMHLQSLFGKRIVNFVCLIIFMEGTKVMKNRFNQRIFKAVAMAIAATMAFSSPLSVVAEDNITNPDEIINNIDAQSAPKRSADEYKNLEQSTSQEASDKRTDLKNAQDAAADAASIASSVENAIDATNRQIAVDNASALVSAAETAANALGQAATEDQEATGQNKVVQDAINAADAAVGDINDKNPTGVAKEVQEANDAASTANSDYKDLVTAAGNNASSAWETVNGTKDKDGAADMLGELKSDVQEYNNEVIQDQSGVYGDAFTAYGKNWENFKDVVAVNSKTAELNEQIEAAETAGDVEALRNLKSEAEDNVEAASQAVSDAKDNYAAAIAKYNYYAMKYNKPLYGETEIEKDREANLEKAGITPMSLVDINKETWDIMVMQISEQEIDQARDTYVQARNAYYGAVSDIPAAYLHALQMLGVAYDENDEALDLEDQINKDLNGEDTYSWNFTKWRFEKKHIAGATDYIEEAELSEADRKKILGWIQDGLDKVEEARDDADLVIEHDVNKAQDAVDKTSAEKISVYEELNGKPASDGQEAVKGIYEQITDKNAEISRKSTEIATQQGIVDQKKTAVTNAENAIRNNAAIDVEAQSAWNGMDIWGKIDWVWNQLGERVTWKTIFKSDYEGAFKSWYKDNKVNSDATVIAARSERDAEQATLNTLNGELTTLNTALGVLTSKKQQKEEQLSQLTTTLATQENELNAANAELSSARLQYLDAIENAEEKTKKELIDGIRDAYYAKSGEINQTEFEKDLYNWSESLKLKDLLTYIFSRTSRENIQQAAQARVALDQKYDEKLVREFLDRWELTQIFSGTEYLNGKLDGKLLQLAEELDEAENKYYDALAAETRRNANAIESSLNKSKSAVVADPTQGDSLANQIAAVQERINKLTVERTPYADRSDDINALTAELNRLTFSVNGLIEYNIFDPCNAQLVGSIMAIENAKKALFSIKMEALKTRGSVKKIDLVNLEWAIKWAEGEVILATLAQENAQAALDKIPAEQQNPVVPVDDDDDDDTTGGDDTTTVIPVNANPTTNVVAPVAENTQAPAVLGARTSRRTAAKTAADTETPAVENDAEVAGAKKEEVKTPEVPKEETKIEDNDTALAATPELEEKAFAWWWLLILAAIAGVSVEEYARRKSNKAKAEAKDSTKINK